MKSVIQLVKTAQGFSIVEQGHQINKITNKATKQKQFNIAPKKFAQQNFTIYPYTYWQELEFSQKYIILPSKSQWFNYNAIHELQRKALPEWFKTKKVVFGAAKPDKFQKNQELYKKYRNYMIDLARNSYLSPTRARSGLAGDVCAILRIHSFLQKNGIINYVYPKRSAKITQQSGQKNNKKVVPNLVRRKDCADRDKSIFQKHFDKDYLQLLKKITKKYRPNCHICEGVCGVLWYEYQDTLFLKTFEQKREGDFKQMQVKKQHDRQEAKINQDQIKQNKVKTIIIRSQNPFTYMLRLCSACFTSGNLPVVLSYEDFKKVFVLDGFTYEYDQPKDKRRINQQNRLIDTLEKNKFNLKRSAQTLKISEKQLFNILINLPICKIEKLARIDQQSQQQQTIKQSQELNGHTNHKQKTNNHQNGVIKKQKKDTQIQGLILKFQQQCEGIEKQQEKLYEQMIQLWLAKITTKLTKLSEWEKTTKWFYSRLVHDQKNNLAEAIKDHK